MSEPFISHDAVIQQLMTIKNIIDPTIKMFKTTNDINDIQVNLNAINSCIECLRPDPNKEPEE